MKKLLFTPLLLLSVVVLGQQRYESHVHIEDKKAQTVFEQGVCMSPEISYPDGYPQYYLRTKLTYKGKLVYLKDDNISQSEDEDLPIERKEKAFATLKKLLKLNNIINH